MRRLLTPLALAALLAGCAHPEDRRWAGMTVGVPKAGEIPSASVYAFAPPKAGSRTGLRDLSDHGQAALIDTLAKNPAEAAALRKLLATPLEGEGGGGGVDRTRLARTIVISVRKGPVSAPGDRLMRTVVTIKPHQPDGEPVPFEFAGYSVVATDTKVQSIAKLETTTEASLSASLAPEIGGFGDNSVSGELSHTRNSTADIVQQYENLGVDIQPEEMTITRESERGLDVVGNTLIALTLAPTRDTERGHSAFLGGTMKLYDKGKMLGAKQAALEIQPFRYFARCDLNIDVTMHYQLRRIVKGREYYTEGKQEVEIVTADAPGRLQTLVRAGDAQAGLYQILSDGGRALLASQSGSERRRLLFDSFDDAKRMAVWLNAEARQRVGAEGPELFVGSSPSTKGMQFRADSYSVGCPGAPPQ